MTYATIETSNESGAPVELYEFTYGNTHWYYTSGDEDVTYQSKTYISTVMTREALKESGEINQANLTITVQRDNEVADLFRLYPPAEVVMVKISRYHRDDAEVIIPWVGRILNVEWRDGLATLHTEPVFTSILRNGLHRFYQRQCPHLLYGAQCGLSRSAFKVSATVINVINNVIQVNEAAQQIDGYFAGGYIAFVNMSGSTENRLITDHTSIDLTLPAAVPGLAAGDAIELYPGCDHVLNTCDTKFSNSLNYGGYPWIPTLNPFGGTTLF